MFGFGLCSQEYEGFMLKVVSVRVPHTAAVLMERQPPLDQTFRNILLSSSEAKFFHWAVCIKNDRSVGDQWYFGADPDPRIRLRSSVTLRMGKFFFFIFFSYNLPAGTLSSVFNNNYLLKFCLKILHCKQYFSPLNTFMRKGKDPDPGGTKTS